MIVDGDSMMVLGEMTITEQHNTDQTITTTRPPSRFYSSAPRSPSGGVKSKRRSFPSASSRMDVAEAHKEVPAFYLTKCSNVADFTATSLQVDLKDDYTYSMTTYSPSTYSKARSSIQQHTPPKITSPTLSRPSSSSLPVKRKKQVV